jgi:uncharacterized iron-regulated membrane protein
MSQHADVVDPPPAPQPDRRAAVKRWWRRKPINRSLVLTHRWIGLVLGLFLVIECTTGAVLLYQGDLFRATNGKLYHHTASATPISAEQALNVVKQEKPDFGAIWVARDAGVWVVGDVSYENQWFVDPGTGRINGIGSQDHGILGLFINIHDCAFGCAGYPAHITWFETELWAGGPTFMNDITRGGFILGVLGLVLIVLVLTSLKIWWPGRKRIKQRFVVRRGKGRFARDYDLHNVVGAVALPFLLMWGITGAAFEFPVVEKAWLAITAGDQPKDEDFSIEAKDVPKGTPTISVDQATSVALAQLPGSSVNFIGVPSADANFYEIDLVSTYASYKYRSIYSGDAYVLIDPYDATHFSVIEGGKGPVSNRFYDKFLEPTHFGWNVNGWWRIIWLLFGLAPLVLMITGVSTWLYRRGVKKRRKQTGARPIRDAELSPDTLDREGTPAVIDLDADPVTSSPASTAP